MFDISLVGRTNHDGGADNTEDVSNLDASDGEIFDQADVSCDEDIVKRELVTASLHYHRSFQTNLLTICYCWNRNNRDETFELEKINCQ